MLLVFGEGNKPTNIEDICDIDEEIISKYKIERITKYMLPTTTYYKSDSPSDIDSALSWMYPDDTITDIDYITNRVVLSISNARVDYWNHLLQQRNPDTNLHKLYSTDSFAEVDDDHGHLSNLLTHKISESLSNSQIPQYCLQLKINDICLVMRPLKSLKLANNQRVRVKKITSRLITVETIDSKRRIVSIPRIRFKYKPTVNTSYKMMRVQFPLRLCYAMTINKSQGQSFDQILLDITESSFCHGQTYVAWSRVRSFDKIRLIVTNENLNFIDDRYVPAILNYLYPKIILTPTTVLNEPQTHLRYNEINIRYSDTDSDHELDDDIYDDSELSVIGNYNDEEFQDDLLSID
jgi:hypothetical protein